MDTTLLISALLDELTLIVGDNLLSVYSMGSLAHGGFCPLVSDIDIAVLLRNPSSREDRFLFERVKKTMQEKELPLAERLSIFFGSVSDLNNGSKLARFPSFDRKDLLEHGQLLLGEDMRVTMNPPKRDWIISEGAEFALQELQQYTDFFLGKNNSLLHDRRLLTKLIVFPVRFLCALKEDRILNTTQAMQCFEKNYVDASIIPILSSVQRCREGAIAPEQLFPAVKEHLVPLYQLFISEYISDSALKGRSKLVDALVAWSLLLTC